METCNEKFNIKSVWYFNGKDIKKDGTIKRKYGKNKRTVFIEKEDELFEIPLQLLKQNGLF